jgi:hypothetical protein
VPSPTRLTALDVVVRLGLAIFALVLLWQVPEPTVIPIPTEDGVERSTEAPVLLLTLYAALGALAGAAFALIARPSWGSWTFRWSMPMAVASIPAAIIVIQLLVFAGTIPYTTEGIYGSVISFLVSNFSLRVPAILVGVALAQGVVSDGVLESEDELPPDSGVPSSRES